MALIHHLYVGHFVPHDGFIRLQQGVPVCDKPLSIQTIAELLSKYLGNEITMDNLPSHFGLSITPNYIVGNRYGSTKVLKVIADYAKQTGAYIVDMGSLMMLDAESLTSN